VPAEATIASVPMRSSTTAATNVPVPGPYPAGGPSRRSSTGGRSRAGADRAITRAPVLDAPNPELFREVFGRFATGVAVITSAGPGGPGGMTANSLCSLSLEPLMTLVCIENGARTLPIVREAGRFALNVLGAEQEDLAGLFASKLPEAEKLEEVAHHFEHRMPIIDGTLAWAVCDLRELIAGGDHTIALGEIVAMGLGVGRPLLWFGGRYHAWPG